MKKESLSLTMPKMIMIVSLIVCVGALIGAVGYLAMHKTQTNIPTVNPPIKSEVVVSTDKTEYEQEDSVEITVTNNFKQSIFSVAASSTPEFSIKNIEKQKSDGTWEELPIYNCSWPECYTEVEGVEIKSGELEKFSWKPMTYINEKNINIEQGLYRLNLEYQIKDKEWKTVYSNEFTIKEKLSGVTVMTDKTEYEQGEEIKTTVKNNSDKSIWYIKEICPSSCCNLQRWENNEWKNLGNPISCIQVIPPQSGESSGRAFVVKPDELKPGEIIQKQWNMKIGGKFAENGKYKLSFYYVLTEDFYAEKTVYSNEFTIKGKKILKSECKEKSDGTSCTAGLWYDEIGRACGGQSCVGLGLGKCYKEECVFLEE